MTNFLSSAAFDFFHSLNPSPFTLGHHHARFELNIVIRGVCRYGLAGGETFDLTPGWVVVFPAHTWHSVISGESALIYGFYFPREAIQDVIDNASMKFGRFYMWGLPTNQQYMALPDHYNDAETLIQQLTSLDNVPENIPARRQYDWGQYQTLISLFEQAQTAYADANFLSAVRITHINLLMTVAAIQVLLARARAAPANTTEQQIHHVKSWIDSHYLEPILVSQLAEMASLSTEYFSKRFEQLIGALPKKYLERCRLHHAGMLLRETEETVVTIASRCGYANAAYFSRAFKIYFRVSPGQFRQQFRQMLPGS